MAVRYYKRTTDLGDFDARTLSNIMREAKITSSEAEEIYRLTTLSASYERFVLPPIQREEAMSSTCNPEICKGSCGVGFAQPAERGL
jgi:nitrate reductase beta subunit